MNTNTFDFENWRGLMRNGLFSAADELMKKYGRKRVSCSDVFGFYVVRVVGVAPRPVLLCPAMYAENPALVVGGIAAGFEDDI